MSPSDKKTMVIAIDGPAASGKGTLAKNLATALGFDHLDTGLLYRAVGRKLMDAGIDPADPARALQAAESLGAKDLERNDLKGESVASAASICSGIPAVRQALLEYQLRFAAHPPHGKGAVLDGRDIGTVVCPNAELKLFITASPEARALRRHAEALSKGDTSQSLASIAKAINERDAREATRAVSPVLPAADARIIDTSNLTVAEVLAQAMAHASEAQGREPAAKRGMRR